MSSGCTTVERDDGGRQMIREVLTSSSEEGSVCVNGAWEKWTSVREILYNIHHCYIDVLKTEELCMQNRSTLSPCANLE